MKTHKALLNPNNVKLNNSSIFFFAVINAVVVIIINIVAIICCIQRVSTYLKVEVIL